MALIEIVEKDDAGKPFTASTFLEYLNVAHPRWQRSRFSSQHRYFDREFSSDWVFRGHEDATWKLLPSFWRSDSAKMKSIVRAFQKPFAPPQVLTAGTWHGLYLDLLDTFNVVAERNGLMKRVNLRSGMDNNLHAEHLDELEAIAQHYGLPTRLIDWSYDLFVAAFFSSRKSAESEAAASCCVWCLDTSLADRIELTKLPQIVIVKAALNTADRIQAQRGLFTRLGSFDEWMQTFFDSAIEVKAWPDLETIISSPKTTVARNDGELSTPFLRKVMLARTETPELVRQLHFRGVSYSSLFPGLEGVAAEVLGYI